MSILITICARGGSKGIPGKNIKDLNAKKYMLMGVNPDFLNLNINLPKYHIFNVHKQIIIKTDPISEINNNQMLKKQLWDAIKVWKV